MVGKGQQHDFSVFKDSRLVLHLNALLLADSGYRGIHKHHQNSTLPVKKKKGQKRLELFDRILSTAVSRVRQPIESLFNWLQEKTDIQSGSKIRSYNGLMVHVFGRLAAAMFLMVFNS